MLIDYEKTRGSGFLVSDCLNLRPDARGDNGILVPVGVPVAVAPAGFSPLVADESTLFITKDLSLFTVDTSTDGKPSFLCTLPSAARCAVVTANTVWVMTANGPFRIDRSAPGVYTVRGLMPAWPAIALQAVEGDVFESEIVSGKVSTLAARVCDAYAQLDRQARAAGQLLQPVVARVRIYDDEGALLHTGPEVLVSGPQGAQLCGSLRFETTGDGDERVTTARMLQARGWHLEAHVDDTADSAWADIALRADIEVCPQFHPYDRQANPLINNVRNSSKGEITMTMPGAERGLTDVNIEGSRRRVASVVERFDALATTVHSVTLPYVEPWRREIAVHSGNVDSDVAAMQEALAARPARCDIDSARLQRPHSFTADCAARSAATVVWGNAQPVLFGGWDAPWFATSNDTRPWLGSVTVDLADGSRLVTTMSGTAAPTALNPIISYPLPTARRLTVSVLVDGESAPRVFTANLLPDATGRRTLAISDELQPVILQPDDSFTIPTPKQPASTPSLFIAANAANATTARAHMRQGRALLAIAPVTAAATGVDTPPCRFYAVGRDAIDLVSANAGATALSSTFLTSAKVDTAACVAPSNNGVYLLADKRLLELKGITVNTLAEGIAANAIVVDDAAGEVLAVNSDDNECVHLMMRNHLRRYHSSLVAYSVAGRYAVTAEGIVDLCRREVAETTPIVWRASYVTDSESNTPVKSMEWRVKGSNIAGTLVIERTWLTASVRRPATMASIRVNGTLASPVTMPLNSHPAREIALKISASVSADFAMTYPKISV